MAKILLADDNSNVHKTVALALASLGVEVSSVNNGDAAIKKLSDFSPDLILADIFMPVRSGYEVCEYVKKNPRFANVPVVLLVGAFDPLDEREAQRVGADGILKKPFVPPDPLITMVKTLLHRVIGERPAEVVASKDTIPVLAVAGKSMHYGTDSAPAEANQEAAEVEFRPANPRVDYSDTHLPAAFSQLLEAARATSPTVDNVDPAEHDQVLTSQRDSTLGEPIFWKNNSAEEDSQEEAAREPALEIEIPAWSASIDAHSTAGHNGEPQSVAPDAAVESKGAVESDAAVESKGAVESDAAVESYVSVEPLEFVSEEREQAATSIVDSAPLQLDLAAQTPLTVEPSPAEDLAANPIEWLASVPSGSAQAESSTTESELIGADAIAPAELEAVPTEATELASTPAEVALPSSEETAPVETETAQTLELEEYGSQAAEEASPTQAQQAAVDVPATRAESQLQAPKEAEAPASAKPLGPDDTLPSVSEHWSDLTASISERADELTKRPGLSASEQVAQIFSAGLTGATSAHSDSRSTKQSDSVPVETCVSDVKASSAPHESATGLPVSAQSSAPDPALVEAVVQKVISKMSPQVVDIITREFLRPIVQALVHRAIEK